MATMALLLGLLGVGLTRDPSVVPSARVGHAAPDFDLPALDGPERVALSDTKGKPALLNFWASWCTTCRQEHPELVRLGLRSLARGEFTILGINYRDDPARAQMFLNREGHFPYPSGVDERGRLGIDYGVYGMPETFFIDSAGVVQARHAGALTPQILARYLPLIGVTP
jgi:cytochrome c biogenesis protein CcmG/thiol:disulfide interchange protein DsbE